MKAQQTKSTRDSARRWGRSCIAVALVAVTVAIIAPCGAAASIRRRRRREQATLSNDHGGFSINFPDDDDDNYVGGLQTGKATAGPTTGFLDLSMSLSIPSGQEKLIPTPSDDFDGLFPTFDLSMSLSTSSNQGEGNLSMLTGQENAGPTAGGDVDGLFSIFDLSMSLSMP